MNTKSIMKDMNKDQMTADKLVRWRANPKKIRVSIRKSNQFPIPVWRATIRSLITDDFVFATSSNPEEAVMDALEKAELENFDGIDIGMQWAYTHPWL
jgi:hypothetical protein